MYNDYFGLKREPFSIAPDPRYLFMSDRHREALAHLLYGVNGGGGFVLLTGEVGAGKTTVCRAFLEQVPEHCHVAYIFNPKLNAVELLQTTCQEFGIALPASAEGAGLKACIDALNHFLLNTHARGEHCVLIIDEAQNLSAEVLEQLRLLTNLETSERKLLQIILIGQPELRDMLLRPDMEQMAQRVIARYHLDALSEPETAQYVAHRLAVSGWNAGPLFDAKALKRIHELTRGIPRRINVLCDRALLGAYATGQRTVGTPIANKAAAEIYDQLPKDRAPAARQPAGAAQQIPVWFWGVLGGVSISCMVAAGLLVYLRQQPAEVKVVQASTPLSATPAASSAPITSSAPSTAVAASSTAEPPALPASTPSLAAPAQLADLNDWLSGAPPQAGAGWQALGKLWQLELNAGSACQDARKQQALCFESEAGLDLIRQLQRPCVLKLYDRNGRRVHALLTALGTQTATLSTGTDAASQQITVSLTDLAKVWRGEFGTLWRTPMGYTKRLEPGSTGTAVSELARQLAQWRGKPEPSPLPTRYEAAVQAQVHAFQITQGIQPDGIAGAKTLMQLNRLTGVDEPRLTMEP